MKKTKPNVILITVDSLRADHLGCYGYSKPTSPNIDRLAEESYLFANAFSNGPNTPHAFPAIMASRYPLMSNRLGLFDAPVCLAEILKATGYFTAAFNAANPWISRYFQYHRGFDVFEDFIDFTAIAGNAPIDEMDERQFSLFQKSLDSMAKLIKSIIPESSNVYNFLEHWKVFLKSYAAIHLNIDNKRVLLESFYKRTLAWIKSNTETPFFLWLHLMDTHYPYIPLDKYLKALDLNPCSRFQVKKIATIVKHSLAVDSATLQLTQDIYDGAVKELDTRVGAIFDSLTDTGHYDDSIIFFTADHGEEFYEHHGLKHTSKLFDELIHVPLILKVPGMVNGARISDLTSHLGLLPSLCDLLEVSWDHNDLSGCSFLDSLQSPFSEKKGFVISETAIDENGEMPTDQKVFDLQRVTKVLSLRTSKWKLIRNTVHGLTHLFDLNNDPQEQENLIAKDREIAAKLDEILRIHVRRESTELLRNNIGLIKDKFKV